jgi:hypothetical protein
MDTQLNGVPPGTERHASAGRVAGEEPGGVELLHFAQTLCGSANHAELQKRFTAGFGRLFDLPMWGLYTLDPWTGRPQCVASMGVSDSFLARYERG